MKPGKLAAKLFCYLLFFIPFIVWQGYYEGPKVFFLWGIGGLLTLFWIWRTIYYKKPLNLTKTDLWFWLWITVLTISSLLGVHPFESVVGGSLRHQGVIFFIALWLVFKTAGLLSSTQKQFLHKGLAVVVLVETIIVFLQNSFGALYFGRPLGTIGESNAVAGFLAIGTYYVFKNMDPLFFALPVMSLLIAQSRTGLLALIPNTLFLIKNWKPKIQKIMTIVFILSAIVFVASITNVKQTSFYENRTLIAVTGLKEVLNRPVLGYGAESGEVVYDAAFKKARVNLEGLVIDRSHNLFLDVLLWSGILGLITFCGFLLNFYIDLQDKYKKLAMVSFIIYSIFQPLSVTHYLFIFLL